VALFVGGYFGLGWAVEPARARALATPLDSMIPFLPRTIFTYLLVFPVSLLPLFVVRSRRLFRRVILAYAIAIVVSLAIFVAWPVTSVGLRADSAALDPTRFTDWCVSVVYRLDPPVNLFPSLHLSIAALTAAAAWKARRLYGVAALAGLVAIAVSICTVKQHFVLDGLGGLALAAMIGAAVIRPFRPIPEEGPLTHSWKGPAAYLVFQALVYAGFYLAFRLG
jgi:hypothetical protein